MSLAVDSSLEYGLVSERGHHYYRGMPGVVQSALMMMMWQPGVEWHQRRLLL